MSQAILKTFGKRVKELRLECGLFQEKLKSIENEKANLQQQLAVLEKTKHDPIATIELVYSKFKQGNTMADEYLEASPAEKRIKLSEVLSNSTLENRNIVNFQYKSPYNILARTPEKATISQLRRVRDSNLTDSVQVVDIFVTSKYQATFSNPRNAFFRKLRLSRRKHKSRPRAAKMCLRRVRDSNP